MLKAPFEALNNLTFDKNFISLFVANLESMFNRFSIRYISLTFCRFQAKVLRAEFNQPSLYTFTHFGSVDSVEKFFRSILKRQRMK